MAGAGGEGATPSDRIPAVLDRGVTDVRTGVFSLSARSPDGLDAAYLEWHTLDHLPEQYRIAELRNGTRWVSTPACRRARAAAAARYEEVDHVVAYLFADPASSALDTFFGLGADLAANGRIPMRLPAVELGGWRLAATVAAGRIRAGADVLPWRPARGSYLLIEEGHAPPDRLVAVAGVAGCWQFEGTGSLSPRLADTAGLHLTVCYLDEDPAAVAESLRPVLESRWAEGNVAGVFAAPFTTVVPFAWDRSRPGG